MKVYTYSQARQKLAQLLDDARQEGQVQIKRRNGQTFVIKPVEEKKSPLDIAVVYSFEGPIVKLDFFSRFNSLRGRLDKS